MPISAGLWLVNPKKSKRRHKKRRRAHRRNAGKLLLLNSGGKRMARRRRRRARHGRRRRKNPGTLYSYSNRRRRSTRRRHRRKYYAKNRRKSYGRRRGRRRGYRRNANIASRAYGAGRSLFSIGMAKNLFAGVVGFMGVNVIRNFVPAIGGSGAMGTIVQKGLAAVGTVVIGKFVFKGSSAKYLMYGAGLNIAFDLLQSQFPAIAAKGGLSGFGGLGDGYTLEPTIQRIVPYLSQSIYS